MKITADIRIQPVQLHSTAAQMVAGHKSKFESAGLSTYAHAMGLNVQGEARDIFAALRDILSEMHSSGTARAFSSITIEFEATHHRRSKPKSLPSRTPADEHRGRHRHGSCGTA